MTGLVQTSSDKTRPGSSFPLIVSGLLKSCDLSSLPDGRSIAYFSGCLYIFLIYCFYHLTILCNNFYGLSALVGYWSSAFIRRIIYNFLNVRPSDKTAFAVSGKVGIPLTGLTTPVAWLSLPQRPSQVGPPSLCNGSFWWRFCVVMLLFGFFCRCRGFCHRTESDLFLFLFTPTEQVACN